MRLKLILPLLFIASVSSAQDTVRYCQENLAPYGSNCYRFYKVKKTDKSGTFERSQGFDDGQNFYGTGKFIESKKVIKLKPYLFIKIHDIYKIIIKNGVAEDSIVKGVRDTFRLKNGETLLKYKSRLYDYYSPIKGSKKRQRIYYNLTAGKW
jgi:hypothetical protein